ncbi:MAG: CBS domain-containing protein [Pseudomonadota bacterium]
MKVEAILKEKGHTVINVSETASLGDAAQLLSEKNIGAVLVTQNRQQPAGILSERDIVRHLATDGDRAMAKPVAECMTRALKTCTPQDSVDDIMGLMTRHRIRHMPVMEAGAVVGMISIGDVVKRKINEAEQEAEALKAYIAT